MLWATLIASEFKLAHYQSVPDNSGGVFGVIDDQDVEGIFPSCYFDRRSVIVPATPLLMMMSSL